MRWLLLDRDDTILDDPGYLNDPEEVSFLPGALDGLSVFYRAGWPLVVVSNQSGVGRGLVTHAQLKAVHERFEEGLARQGIYLSGFYYCPHTPEQNCSCRKPEPGLAIKAAQELNLDLKEAVVVGDKESDLELGKRINAAYLVQLASKEQHRLGLADEAVTTLAQLANKLLGQSHSR